MRHCRPERSRYPVVGPRRQPGGNTVVAAWSEKVRFAAKRGGYHGGASPQEVLVPVAVLASRPAARRMVRGPAEGARLVAGARGGDIAPGSESLGARSDAAARTGGAPHRPQTLRRRGKSAGPSALASSTGAEWLEASSGLRGLRRAAAAGGPRRPTGRRPARPSEALAARGGRMTRAGLAQALGSPTFPPGWSRQRGPTGAESRPGAGAAGRRRRHRPGRSPASRPVRHRGRPVIGAQRRAAILDALRRGTVPREGLAAFAVGMERFEAAIDADLAAVAGGRGGFKAVRGEYGSRQDLHGALASGAGARGGVRDGGGANQRDRDSAPSLGDGLSPPCRTACHFRHP